jgi:hypothetical protein
MASTSAADGHGSSSSPTVIHAKSFVELCKMESLIVPAGDSDVKSMLKDSGVILLADWASSGKKKVNDRRERACALLWARSMLHEPEAYLHLSPTLMTYLQGLYKIRAEHLKTSRWAVALASIVSANMADKGDTPQKEQPADGRRVSKRATRPAASSNLSGALFAASDRQPADSQQQSAASQLQPDPASTPTSSGSSGAVIWSADH